MPSFMPSIAQSTTEAPLHPARSMTPSRWRTTLEVAGTAIAFKATSDIAALFSTAGTALGTVKTLYSTDLATGKLPITPGPTVKGGDAFFVIGRALPGPDPQSFQDQTAWDLHGGVKVLAP